MSYTLTDKCTHFKTERPEAGDLELPVSQQVCRRLLSDLLPNTRTGREQKKGGPELNFDSLIAKV